MSTIARYLGVASSQSELPSDAATTSPNSTAAERKSAEEIFAAAMQRTYVDADRVFARIMLLQWAAGILTAFIVSPYTWIGNQSQVHLHVWAAVVLGAAISSLPVFLAWKYPGSALTRHVVAAAQMLWSALLIHLTGGRIETHFHVFVSLAFLALYRDWHVLLTATIVIAGDHFVRGIWWPQSVFGVVVESPFRWIEHAVWVVFEDIILIRSCRLGVRKTWTVALREAELSATNDSLESQIRERRRAEAEARRLYNDLTQAHEEAVAASQVKSQFLANMSHERRTPLNAIIGYSELLQLLAQRKNDTSYHADLERIQKAGKHLLMLINDILDISKIEAGKMQLEMQVFDVTSILDDVRETVQPLAEQNGNQLELQIADELPAIPADAIRLKQCLLNLLSNACKFTHHGRVTFTACSEAGESGEMLRFSVTDTGVGLSEEQVARLFQPFTQADASTTRKYGGTGLGLAITKKLCEAMGGGISVQSRLGEGSTFSILLPAQQTAAAV
jgi:signal transduction histidine kinase